MEKNQVKQMILPLSEGNTEVFFDAGFFEGIHTVSPIHNHEYTELHFAVRGFTTLIINKKEYNLTEGDLLAIPAGVTHTSRDAEGTVHRAFLMNVPLSKVELMRFPPEILCGLVSEIESFIATGVTRCLSKYVMFLCKDILGSEPQILDVGDRKFVMHDFFANNYHRQIQIDDLAERLKLSTKQTQRLVRTYTGNTFGKELTKVRIEAARLLMKENKNLTLLEISHRVGYRSYSGFWKAFKTSGTVKANK